MNSQIESYWSDALELLKETLSEPTFNSIIKKLEPLFMEDGTFTLKTNSNVYKSIIEKRCLAEISDAVQVVTGEFYEIRIATQDDLRDIRKNAEFDKLTDDKNFGFKTNLKSKYIFETFVRGKSNELAYAAAKAVAEAPGRTQYNPLFLYGGVGLGKTHLMHSIGNHIKEQNPNSRILYSSTETFVNELINSILKSKNQEFRNKYREIDVLLIDDIQFLSEKESTQEEFFHTFNTLYDDNKQIVISSDQPPKEIKTLEDRLRSRFGCGLIVDVKLPDFETRTAILEKKAELDNIIIPKEVTKFIAKSVASNIRDLEGALNKVTAYAKLTNTPITMELTEKALLDLVSEKIKPEITVPYIQEIVAGFYNLTTEDLTSKRRTAIVTYPRQIAMYLSRKLIDISSLKVGELFGGRDHSTVIHGCDKITDELEKDPNLRNILIELEKKIKG